MVRDRFTALETAVGRVLDIRDRWEKFTKKTGAEVGTARKRELEERDEAATQSFMRAGEILERLWKTKATPDYLMPKFLRFRCLACSDRGVEFYENPNGGVACVRPCKHCGRGEQVLASWRKSEEESEEWSDGRRHKTRRGGPYSAHLLGGGNAATFVPALSDDDVTRIMAYPCAHDPIPGLA